MRIDNETKARKKLPEEIRGSKILKALLVGENAQGSSYFAKRLRERGCQCECATSYEEARSLIGTQDFCLVLSPTRLRARNLLPLMDLLEGSNVSLFYAHSVDQGCWWLPALRRGHKCFGSCAVRPSEFVAVLDETIEEVRSNWHMDDEKQDTW